METSWSYWDYQRMHRLEAECSRLTHLLDVLEAKESSLTRRLLDLEAESFADKTVLEIDLETWDGIHASHVGRDLEEVANKLISAIEANRRGEDIDGALFDIHGDVCSIMADIRMDTGEW